MPVVRASDAPVFQVPGFRMCSGTAPSRGATDLCAWKFSVEPGAQSEAHWLDHEEVFLVLDGRLSASVDGDEIEVAAGDALVVPARALLQITNRSPQAVDGIACLPVGTQAMGADGHLIGTPPWAR